MKAFVDRHGGAADAWFISRGVARYYLKRSQGHGSV